MTESSAYVASLQELLWLIPSGQSSAVVPSYLAHEFLLRLEAQGHSKACAHGHEWTVATARVRIRDRRREGRGVVMERDCRVCKHIAYVESVRHVRHQMKGGRLT